MCFARFFARTIASFHGCLLRRTCLDMHLSWIAWLATELWLAVQDLVGMSLMPSEAHLLRQMLSRDPTERPTMAEALDHPCLWNETNICNFLVYVSDYLQALNKVSQSHEIDNRSMHVQSSLLK